MLLIDFTINLLYITGAWLLWRNIYYAIVNWLNGWEPNFHDTINNNKLYLYTGQILSSDVCIRVLKNTMAPFSNGCSHKEYMKNTLSCKKHAIRNQRNSHFSSLYIQTMYVNLQLNDYICILILIKLLDCH